MRLSSGSRRRVALTLLAIASFGLAGISGARDEAALQHSLRSPNPTTDPLLRGFEFRSIGPAIMMGRVDDIAGVGKGPDDRLRRLRHRRPLEVHRRRHPLEVAVRQSCPTNPSAPSPSRRPIRTWSMSARAKPTTGRAPRSATACGAPPTAAAPGSISASTTHSPSRASWWIRPIPRSSMWRPWATCSDRIPSAACTKPPMAARTGRRSKYIDPDTGFTDVAIDPANPKIALCRVATSAGAPGGATTAAARAAACGNHRRRRHLDQHRRAGLAESQGRHLRPHRDLALPRQADDHLCAGGGGRQRRHRRRHGRGWRTCARRTRRRRPANRLRRNRGARRCRAAGRRGGSRQRSGRPRETAVAGAAGAADRRRLPIPTPAASSAPKTAARPGPFMSNQNQRPTYFSQIRVDPVERSEDLRRRQPRADVAWMAARPGRPDRIPHRLSRLLDQSQGPAHRLRRPRWRHRHQQRRRRRLGIITTTSPVGPVLSGVGRHAPALLRLRRSAGQQRVVRTQRAALHHRPGQHGLVHGGRRRRLLHPPGPHRLGHRLRRIAGRQHDPSRYARRHAEEHPSQRRRGARRRRPATRPRAANVRRRDDSAPRRMRPTPGWRGGAAAVAAADAAAAQRRQRAAELEAFRFYWNAPFEISPHNPAVVYMAGAVLLQVHQSRRHLVDESHRPHEEHQSLVGRTCPSWASPATSRWRRSTMATPPVRWPRRCANRLRVPA